MDSVITSNDEGRRRRTSILPLGQLARLKITLAMGPSMLRLLPNGSMSDVEPGSETYGTELLGRS
jgi:hypothetical protein